MMTDRGRIMSVSPHCHCAAWHLADAADIQSDQRKRSEEEKGSFVTEKEAAC